MNAASEDRDVGTTGLSQRYFLIIAYLTLAVSLLKGLRMPNRWAISHLTFNYSEGFTRRGLIGELFWLVGRGKLWSYNLLVGFSVLIFVAATVAMARVAGRMLRGAPGGDLGVQGAVLVLAASPAVVCFANLIGYLDHIGLLLLLLFIPWAAGSRRRYLIFPVAALLAAIWALIHESQIIMFAPTLAFALICHVINQQRRGSLSRRDRVLLIAATIAVMVFALGASAVISLAGTRDATLVRAMQARVARTADFPLRGDAFDFLTMPASYNLFVLMLPTWRQWSNVANLFRGFAVLLATIGYLLYYGVRLVRRLGLTVRTQAILIIALFAATLAPLLLNFVGWDTARWNAVSAVACFCCVAILKLSFAAPAAHPNAQRIADGPAVTLAAAGVILGLCSSYGSFLLGGRTVHWFPFDAQFTALAEIVAGQFRFVSPD